MQSTGTTAAAADPSNTSPALGDEDNGDEEQGALVPSPSPTPAPAADYTSAGNSSGGAPGGGPAFPGYPHSGGLLLPALAGLLQALQEQHLYNDSKTAV